ncbi:MAG: glycosyltransferase, partial [Phycisphaerales bacterium]|nr:glycosyltransferase [Phycisphaerales bacterium]
MSIDGPLEIQPIQQYSIDRTRLFTTESEGLDSVRTCVSILIPSRGRSAKLANLLDALSDQVLDDNVEIEVIVVIDGDGTPPDVPVSLDVQLHRTVHVGAGAARNIAMSCARGQLLLFLNDDVVPEPRCVMAHVRAHDGQHPMVLGYSPWLQPEQPTWFDAFVQHTPCIFGQIPTHDGALLDWRSAWTLNLSVKASCIASQNARFDECIRPVYFEDIEFAYRLFGHDRAIWYAPEAVALHDHRVTMREYFAREVLLG